MFPVLVRIDNRAGLLRPGMNSEVEIHVGEREGVLAVPNAALRTQRDVGSAAQVLGLSPDQVQQELASQAPGRSGAGAATAAGGQAAMGGSAAGSARAGRDTGGTAARREGRAMPSGAMPSSARRGRSADPSFGGRYIVFVQRPDGPKPVWIRTGLTDLDYSEVVEGLQADDSVLVLPSASLVQSQEESRERINRITGGGGLPGMQQQTAPAAGARSSGAR
jgi:HlyD family secretion protein